MQSSVSPTSSTGREGVFDRKNRATVERVASFGSGCTTSPCHALRAGWSVGWDFCDEKPQGCVHRSSGQHPPRRVIGFWEILPHRVCLVGRASDNTGTMIGFYLVCEDSNLHPLPRRWLARVLVWAHQHKVTTCAFRRGRALPVVQILDIHVAFSRGAALSEPCRFLTFLCERAGASNSR